MVHIAEVEAVGCAGEYPGNASQVIVKLFGDPFCGMPVTFAVPEPFNPDCGLTLIEDAPETVILHVPGAIPDPFHVSLAVPDPHTRAFWLILTVAVFEGGLMVYVQGSGCP